MKKNIAELIGTFALVFLGCSTIIFMKDEVGLLGVALAFGLTVTGIAYSLGPISGAHLNPAVSLGAMLAGRMTPADMIGYWVAQVAGGLLAAIVLMAMGGAPGGAATSVGVSGTGAAVLFELVATFLFVTVILGATKDGSSTVVAGLAIGLTLVVVHLAGITVSGASVNPARSIATNIFSANIGELWIYILAPLVGGGLAGYLHKAGVTAAD